MQIFILLYIEAGSYLNEEEDGWEFVVLSVTLFSFFFRLTRFVTVHAGSKSENARMEQRRTIS
jgi:hypothetical protein